jgi:hypothetical protein
MTRLLLLLALVEVQTESALSVLVGQLVCGEGDTQEGRQSSSNPVSRVRVANNGHHGRRTDEWLDFTLDPVDCSVLDAVLGKDGEDVGVGVTAGRLLGGAGIDRYPEDDMIVQDVLAVAIARREANRHHRRDVNAARLVLEKWDDLGSKGLLPELVIQDLVDESVDLLLGDGRVPARRMDRERTLSEIGTLQQSRRVVRDAGEEVHGFEGRDEVWLRGCPGEVRENRRIAERGRGGRRKTNRTVFQVVA